MRHDFILIDDARTRGFALYPIEMPAPHEPTPSGPIPGLSEAPPRALDLKKDRGLTVEWADGSTSYFTIAYLRRMSPSAEARQLREDLASNPLAVLPASAVNATGAPLTALDAELIGNYAIRIRFSDGHDTGLFSWSYLREIDPAAKK